LLMLNKGNWNGTQIMTDTNFFNEMISPSQTLNNSYGYLWWLNGQGYMLPTLQTQFMGRLYPNTPTEAYAALGKDNQLLVVIPSRNLVYIRMGNAGVSNQVGPQMVDDIWIILEKLMCSPIAISNLHSKIAIAIYPNPSHDIVHISSDSKVHAATLYDLYGRPLAVGKDQISMDSFRAGIYYLRVETAEGVIIKKIIKK